MSVSSPRQRRRLLIALPPGQPCLTLSAEIRMALVSNSAHSPANARTHSHPHLTAREAEVIERLLSVCTHYHYLGQHHTSELVDRIGMNMMQAFLARKTPEPSDT
ncbi:hypothetical protein [Celeribacter sp.]|uniref:hypothetical protein n=1 Tax=Celeribacter sp. TaxID=1890673 RepID=UPI003A8D46E2